MELLGIGVLIGAVAGVAITMFLKERHRDDDIPEWSDLLAEQQGHIAHFPQPIEQPRAVTRLTHRERTVEL